MKTKKLLTILLSLCLALSALAIFGCANNRATMPDEGMPTIKEADGQDGVSAFTNYAVEQVHTEALFNKDGSINGKVATALANKVNLAISRLKNSSTTWSSGADSQNKPYDGTPYMESTAADFSNYVLELEANQPKTLLAGGLIIKLFDTSESLIGLNASQQNFASKWWQIVYRSGELNGGKDVLTFYMVEPYRLSQFNPNGDMGGNYSISLARDTLLTDFNVVLSAFNGSETIKNTIVTPSALPGAWQSSEFQTGSSTNILDGRIGTSAFAHASQYSSVNNGLDGLGYPLEGWKDAEAGEKVIKLADNYNDLIAIPSSFEIVYMGNDKDVNTDKEYFGGTTTAVTQKPGRHGLWQLGSLDRGFNRDGVGLEQSDPESLSSWVRSGNSGASIRARVISETSSEAGTEAFLSRGLRPSLNLDLSLLVEKANIFAGFAGEAGAATVKAETINATPASQISFEQYKYDTEETIITFETKSAATISSIFIDGTKLEFGEGFKSTNSCDYEMDSVDGSKSVVLRIKNIKIDLTIRAALNTSLAKVKIGAVTTEYSTIEAAFSYANSTTSSAAITLLANVYSSVALMVNVGQNITLDLSTFTIDRGLSASNPSAGGSVITVYGSFTLKGSGTITGGNAYYGGGISVVGGTLNMQGGTITGNKATGGGGVHIAYGGSFIMSGGRIDINSATSGGGVALLFGTFTMSGTAKITNNSATNDGGGVSVFQSTFTMGAGTTITGNSAKTGGGVHVHAYSTFKQGGTVSDNAATAETNKDVYINGGIQSLR